MFFAFLTLLASLGVAAVTEWFSVVGIMSIYAGAAYNSALIMGLVLGAAKLMTVSWLYRNWKYSGWKLRAPLIYFTVALMVASSIGVYGFLTKAHLEQGSATIDNSAKVERLEQQIAREKSVIADNEKVMGQLDTAINSYLGSDKTDRALAVRRAQAPQRKQLKDEIAIAQKAIDGFSDEKLKLTSEVRAMQLEVGPIKYIADLFYSDSVNATTKIESAVRIFTLLIVSTLDPLAVILLIAANHTILRIQNEKKEKAEQEHKEIENRVIITNAAEAINEKENTNKDVSQQATTTEINIEPPVDKESGIGNKGNVTTQYSDPDATVDEAISAQDSIKDNVNVDLTKTNDWEFKIEVPDVPKETFQPSRFEELLITHPNIDQIVAHSILPEIKIDEEETINMEKVEVTNRPIEDIKDEETMADRQLDQNEKAGTSPDAGTKVAKEIRQVPETLRQQPWAHQPGVLNEFIGNSAHFIPQAIDEKSKKAELASRPKIDTTPASNWSETNGFEVTLQEAPSQEIETLVENRQGQIQKKNGEQVSKGISDVISKPTGNASANDKYPKALSWLTEFKGV